MFVEYRTMDATMQHTAYECQNETAVTMTVTVTVTVTVVLTVLTEFRAQASLRMYIRTSMHA